MYRKSDRVIARSIPRSRSAQVTIFMILGLLILFVFIFVFSLSASIKKGQLQEVQEKTLTKSFKKEALRIFVEDCLTDELEKGLVLIGTQGRLWSDQSGGTKPFEVGISGVTVGSERVFYGITKDTYLQDENAYPCSNESSSPEFCQYSYPYTKVGFGSLQLKTSTIQNDLRRYLLNRTVWCVSEFTQKNISSSAKLESQDIALDLNIQDTGIDVKVHYPLKLSLGNEEFFHLSEFDFFYPTKFKALLDTAVSFPSRMDWQYVDFNYTNKTLKSSFFTYGNEQQVTQGSCTPFKNYFFCNQALFSDQYAALGTELSRKPLANGDDLFVFQASSILKSPELYTYQFARQNRPPALDYVHRLECPAAGYDYLVIPKDEELGLINFTLSAIDPDEDKVVYLVSNDKSGTVPGQNYIQKEVPQEKTISTFRASAADEHGTADWQDVRVLVDRPLDLGVSLFMPYKFWNKEKGILQDYIEIFPKGNSNTYLVSKEDPTFLKVAFPETSFLPSLYKQEVRLFYANKDGKGKESFDYTLPQGLQINGNQGCFSFPGGALKSKDCTLNGYQGDIATDKWKYLLQGPFNHFYEATSKGVLNLSFNAQYCSLFDKSKSAIANIVVNDCVPSRNPAHPWAYPYEDYAYSKFNFNTWQGECIKDKDGNCLQQKINPFEATHSCCIGVAENPDKWQIAPKDYSQSCFVNPEPGCYGQVLRDKEGTPYTVQGRKNQNIKDDPGLVVEVQQRFCDGNRGNICNGDFKNELYTEKLVCGNSTFNQCRTDIPTECQGQPAFSLIENKGWCSGTLGCQSLCSTAVVYTGTEKTTSFSSEDINSLATKLKVDDQTDADFDFKCSCEGKEGKPCDANFDGNFNGVCQADNSCLESS